MNHLLIVIYGSVGLSLLGLLYHESSNIRKSIRLTASKWRTRYRLHIRYRHFVVLKQDGTPGHKGNEVMIVNVDALEHMHPPMQVPNTGVWYFRIKTPDARESISMTYNSRERCLADFNKVWEMLGNTPIK